MKLTMFVLLSIVTVCFAQNEPQAADLQKELVAKLAKYKAESAECTDRVNKLVLQLKKMDVDIERNISKTLEFVGRYTDSVDTDEKVINNKEDILRDLMRSAKRYAGLRDDVVRDLAADRDYVKEDMIKIRDWIDEKIKLRLQQITAVTISLGGYDHYVSGMYYGDDDDEDKDFADSLIERAADEKKDVIKKMRKAIETLSKSSEDLEKELASLKTKRPLEDINSELTEVHDKIEALESSIEDIYSEETQGKQVGHEASREIVKEMRNRVSKLKSSSASFFRNFDAMMRTLRKQKSLDISIEKYEFAIEQLKARS